MSTRLFKSTLVFAAAFLVCVGLGAVKLPSSQASPCEQGVCPGCSSCRGIPCCNECEEGPPAYCTSFCSGSEPGIPTVPGATVGPPPPTLPPLTQQAKSTSESIWATSWVATVGAQETAIFEATQTLEWFMEDIICYSCYETAACASGWAEVCFFRPKGVTSGLMYPYSNDCQAASECEPSSGPKDPECVPGTASGAGTTLDPCEGWEWTWDLRVMADVPPHIVQVWPFPRWLVGMGAPLPAPYESGSPGTLTLQDYPSLSNSPGICSPNWDSEGCWSAKNNKPDPVRDDPLPGDIKDFRIGLRWRRIDIMPGDADPSGAPAICWDWDEREWNIGQDYGYGPVPAVTCGKSASHIYETSSWGKPANGPNFIPAEDACTSWTSSCKSGSTASNCHCCEQVPSKMDDWRRLPPLYEFDPDAGPWQNPAYQVRVPTYWALEWAAEWEQWEQVDSACECHGGPGPKNCHKSGEPEGWCSDRAASHTESEPIYDWRHHDFTDSRWNLVDLRNYGKSTWYHTSYAVRTTGSYAGCAFEYGDPNPGDSVRIPVIEVQSVLRDPCILDGTCPKK